MPTAFITCHFNPMGFARLESNWVNFRRTWKYPALSIESYWDSPKTDSEVLVKATNNQILWQKERLLNILIDSLPPEFDAVCWLDADIDIQNFDVVALESALKKTPVVQLFQSITTQDEQGGVEGEFTGIAANYCGVPNISEYPKEGYAWAVRRDIIDGLGLYDTSILGSGDAYMWNAWTGRWKEWPRSVMTRGIAEHYYDWAWKIYQRAKGRVGYLPLKATHWFHGTRTNRKYVDRFIKLAEHQFNPVSHLCMADNKLWEWSSAAPDKLIMDVEKLFYDRKEDGELDQPERKAFAPDSNRPSPRRIVIPPPKPSTQFPDSYKSLCKALRSFPPVPPVGRF